MKKKSDKSALNIQNGVEPLPNINPYLKPPKKAEIKDPEYYIKGILDGNLSVLSKAITLIESYKHEHRILARIIVEKCLPYSGNSIRIGVTGVPGVGKSTFIEHFGQLIVNKNHKLAVLAVDPSSEKTKGSILGDKTRMENLSVHPNAFIRPSPSGCTLGGVARRTRESIILCEAAGFDVIMIETVGVGQSETVVNQMVDVFLLLMLAGSGDELQGIKRGIMEMADIIVITKADGDNIKRCEIAAHEFKNALHYMPLPESGWTPQVLTCSSITGFGMNELWQMLQQYFELVKSTQYFNIRRNTQAKHWMYETFNDLIKEELLQNKELNQIIAQYEQLVLNNKISSIAAAEAIFQKFIDSLKSKNH
ncbi:MAG: methylmalonyl Co-A mutase-associated GTPase MeaB [Bacteroidales bacterium]|nr:methylmalonyl Co-A mutase-associated GTPase MeaB [Bacteroidales bacterium]